MTLSAKITAALLIATFGPLSLTTVHAANKVGSVTIALSLTYEAGGYDGEYYKVVTDTETTYKELYKSTIKTEKYSTKEFVQDLFSRFSLTGAATDYTIKYVESIDEEVDITGFYIANKTGTVAVYIGGNYSDDRTLPISTYNVTYYNRTLYSDSSTETYKIAGEVWKLSLSGSYKSQVCGTYIYFNPLNENYFETFALVKSGGSYKYSEDYNPTDESFSNYASSYQISASSITGIIGTNYNEGTTLTGSVNISSLKDTADVTLYQNAFLTYIN